MSRKNTVAAELLKAGQHLRDAVDALEIGAPVTHVYNPLGYAWAGYAAYIEKFGTGPKRVVFMGMNPGPFGMAQVGVPFGSIPAVRDWMGIETAIDQPPLVHPKRPVQGFGCPKVEVSGRRLYMELFAQQFPRAEDFFAEHFVLNYCPLVFMTETGSNFTPDKLPAATRAPLEAACDEHLLSTLNLLQPEWAVGVGNYAEKNIQRVCEGMNTPPQITRIIHPAPASPIANREWPENPRAHLKAVGIW